MSQTSKRSANPPPGPPSQTPLTQDELRAIAVEMESLVGAQIQDFCQGENQFGMGFYHRGKILWLWFELSPQAPLVVRFQGRPPLRKKISRPLTLFIRSRFLGRRLKSVRAPEDRGRVLIFDFHRGRDEGSDGPCEIEVRLFPHGQNVIARDGGHAVSELKPKELPPAGSPNSSAITRTWMEIEAEWRARHSPKETDQKRPSSASSGDRDYRRAIEKKQGALVRMREELKAKTSALPAEIGEWLKVHFSFADLPEDWRPWVDMSQSVSWNIENLFHLAKENQRKASGTLERIQKVEAELEALMQGGVEGFERARARDHEVKSRNLLSRAEAKGRRHVIEPDLEVYIGKSASDNLALLRRAQPFDYWLHMRDHVGSHAILRRTRGRIITDPEFEQAGRWVVEQSLGKSARELKGESLDILIVECRYVRPIKGDRLGRVNYSHERVMKVRF